MGQPENDSVLKEMSFHTKKRQRKLKCVLLSGTKSSEKTFMIPTIWCS